MPQSLAHSDFEETPLPAPRGLDQEAKRAFLRMISHELRTPLNSIIGFSEVIKNEVCGPVPPQYSEYAGFIADSGAKMLKLVNQIVEIVRLESHAAELDIHAEPLEHLIDEVLTSLGPDSRALNVRLEAEALETMPWVSADARALKGVLANLLQNAIAHSPPGGTVQVRAFRHIGWVTIEIEDHGPGVDPVEAVRLMRPFEKGAQSLSRGNEGAGLGLSIAMLLTRAMGGELDIRTALGEGLTAIVTLRGA